MDAALTIGVPIAAVTVAAIVLWVTRSRFGEYVGRHRR